MKPGLPRQLATLVALAVAFAATVATSPVIPEVRSVSPSATITLDSSHRMASAVFVVTLPAGAISGSHGAAHATVAVDDASAEDGAGPILPSSSAVTLRVIAVSAENEHGFATPTPNAAPGARDEGGWVVSATTRGSTDIPLECDGAGPCDRAFRLLAILGSDATRAEITWHVESEITWGQLDYPSGLSPSLRIEPPIVAAGPALALDVSTPSEPIVLGPDRPAAVREVEVRWRPTGSSPLPTATLSLAIAQSTNGGVNMLEALYDVTDVTRPLINAMPERIGGQNSFAHCRPDVECVRRYLATFVWKTGDTTTYDWQLIVHRTDLSQVMRETTSPVTIETIASADPIGPPSTLHLEGDFTYTSTHDLAPIPLRVRSEIAAPSEGSRIPTSGFTAPMWPIPGLMRFSVAFARDPGDGAWISVDVDPLVADAGAVAGGPGTPLAQNAFWPCAPDTVCPNLTFYVDAGYPARAGRTAGSFAVHWSLDLTVYSYPGVHYVLERVPQGSTESPSPP
jgi:hypothetical protein